MACGRSAPLLTSREYSYLYDLEGHCDLPGALTDHGASTRPRLDEVCGALGLPGKLGVDGSMVGRMHAGGRLGEVGDQRELDVP